MKRLSLIDKRAQFFIIAAIVISGILVSLAVIQNYVLVGKEPTKLNNLVYELNDESLKVVDYGIYTQQSDMNAALQAYSKNITNYLRETSPDTKFAFIYGNKNNISISAYGVNYSLNQSGVIQPVVNCKTSSLNTIDTSLGEFKPADSLSIEDVNGVGCNLEIPKDTDEITFIISQTNVTIPLEENKYFGFLLRLDKGDNTYVTTK